MEKVIGIILFFIILSFILYSIFVQLSWFNEDRYNIKHNEYIQNLFREKGLKILTIIIPSKRQIQSNPFSKGIHLSFGGSSLGALEKIYFRIIFYQEDNINKKIWVKIVESTYAKTKYKFDRELPPAT